jgi:hypothetical protein
VEIDKASKIYDFMQEVGWINNRNHLSSLPELQRNVPPQLLMQLNKEAENREAREEATEQEQQKVQPLTSLLKPSTCAPVAPLRFGLASSSTTALFKWQRPSPAVKTGS